MSGFPIPIWPGLFAFSKIALFRAELYAEPCTTTSAWSNRVSGTPATSDTPAFTNFEQWRRTQGLDGDNPAASGHTTDDPDDDGVVNVIEYALGGDPLAPDRPGLEIIPGNNSIGLNWPEAEHLLDLAVSLEESTDLSAWASSPLSTTVTSGIRTANDTRVTMKRFTLILAVNTPFGEGWVHRTGAPDFRGFVGKAPSIPCRRSSDQRIKHSIAIREVIFN